MKRTKMLATLMAALMLAASVPAVGASAATPAVTQSSTGWTSDTNSDLTVQPGKSYQFKFTASDPDAIKVWTGTPGVFNVTKTATETNAVYYKITAIGTPGAAAGVYVSYQNGSGTKLCVATVAGGTSSGTTSTPSQTASGWTSDTHTDLTVQPGKSYQFKLTASDPNAFNVWMGTPGVFNVTKAATETNAVYYKITAIGTPGAAAGMYVSYQNGSGTKLCVATVAGGVSSGTTTGGNTSSGSTSGTTSGTPIGSKPSTSETPSAPDTSTSGTSSSNTSGLTARQQSAIDAGLTLGDWSHEYEQEVFDLVNEEREKRGLPKLVWATSVTEKAQARAKELSVKYSHTRPDGSSAGWENIASGQRTPEQVVAAWMASEGHYHNMMDYEVDDAGNVIGATSMAVGCYVNEDGNIWWVQQFNSSDSDLWDPTYRNPLL